MLVAKASRNNSEVNSKPVFGFFAFNSAAHTDNRAGPDRRTQDFPPFRPRLPQQIGRRTVTEKARGNREEEIQAVVDAERQSGCAGIEHDRPKEPCGLYFQAGDAARMT